MRAESGPGVQSRKSQGGGGVRRGWGEPFLLATPKKGLPAEG